MADPIVFTRAAKVSMSCLNVLGGTTPRHVECHKFVFLFDLYQQDVLYHITICAALCTHILLLYSPLLTLIHAS